MKPWCANCRVELPSETSKNSATERLTEFISYHEGYEVKVLIRDAILTVFEHGLQLHGTRMAGSTLVEMCSQCTAVLAELYRFYVEFMKLSRETSYVQELVQQSLLWEFGNIQTDSKKGILESKNRQQGTLSLESSLATVKVQLQADDEDDDLHLPLDLDNLEDEPGTEVAPPANNTLNCKFCEASFGSGAEMNEHILMNHLDLVSTKVCCKLCAKEFLTAGQLSYHLALVHRQKGLGRRKREERERERERDRFPCTVCHKEFTRKADSRRHMRTVHGGAGKQQKRQKGYSEDDDEDNEDQDNEDQDNDDEYTASEPLTATFTTVFKCEQCNKTFRRKDYLKAHEKCHLSAEEKKKELETRKAMERLHKRSKARKPMPKKRKKFSYRCTECNQSFGTRETMKYHRRKVHPKHSFPCAACDRVFHSENELKIHENVKHGVGEKLPDRICPIPGCGKYFALPNIMKRHVQSVHCEDKDRIYECPFCPLKFPIKNRLDTHLKNRHNSDNSLQTLKCVHCGRVYETKSGLAQHIETVHTNLKVYSCEVCGRTSIRPEWLKKHLELHDSSREKKFSCPTCNMKFYRTASLKKHLKNHSGLKNYLCSECGDKFRQTSSLRRHIEAKHSMKNGPFTCDQCGKSFKIKEYLAQHLRAKSHGGRGHGLYTPAGKRRLEREKQMSSSMDPTTHLTIEDEQDQLNQLLDLKGGNIILIQTQTVDEASTDSSSQQQQRLTIVSPSSDTTASASASSYNPSPLALPITTFQATPIQFLTTVNPAWFQHPPIQQQQPPTTNTNNQYY